MIPLIKLMLSCLDMLDMTLNLAKNDHSQHLLPNCLNGLVPI